MDRGGAAGLEIQMEGDEDDDIDEKALEEMSDEDKLMLEQQFEHLYKNDPRLKEALNAEPSELPLLTKYQVILQYQRVNDSGTEGQKEEEPSAEAGFGANGDENYEVITYEGKQYRHVEIEGKEEDYLMDVEGNIYDMNL